MNLPPRRESRVRKPVSYTHLDVYKRQTIYSNNVSIFKVLFYEPNTAYSVKNNGLSLITLLLIILML